MLTLHEGEWTIREGRLTVDELTVGEGARVRNDSEVYTYTTLSEGEIVGKGTLWAHISSKPIGGTIDAMQIIIYWPFDRRFALPVVYGGLVCIPKLKGDGGIT